MRARSGVLVGVLAATATMVVTPYAVYRHDVLVTGVPLLPAPIPTPTLFCEAVLLSLGVTEIPSVSDRNFAALHSANYVRDAVRGHRDPWLALAFPIARAHVSPPHPGFQGSRRTLSLGLWLAGHWSVDEMTRWYASDGYYGRGAYGVEAAAQAHFGKRAIDLDVGETAFLAVALRAPSRSDVKLQETRRNDLLARMAAASAISPQEYVAAHAKPLTLRSTGTETPP